MNTNMRKKDRNTVAPYKAARRALDTGGTGVLKKKKVLSVRSKGPSPLKPNSPIQSRPNRPPVPSPKQRILRPLSTLRTRAAPPTRDSDLPLSSSETQRDTAIQAPLDNTEVLVENPQQDDGEEGEDELSVRVDVPGAEDDACVNYVCVPVVGEQEVSKEGR